MEFSKTPPPTTRKFPQTKLLNILAERTYSTPNPQTFILAKEKVDADTYKIIRTETHDEGKTYTIKCGRGSEHRILHYFRLGSGIDRFYYGIHGRGGWDTLDAAAKEVCDKS